MQFLKDGVQTVVYLLLPLLPVSTNDFFFKFAD